MRICYIADYRSPIARNWIRHFVERGHEVHVISTHPVESVDAGVAGFTCAPIGLAALRSNSSIQKHFAASKGSAENRAGTPAEWLKRITRSTSSALLSAYEWVAPLELRRYAPAVERTVCTIGPDLVHAMRIPFEGILAATALASTEHPLLVSVWGNDFTFHASRIATVAAATRRVLARCTALHADCRRDVRLAGGWNFDARKPATVIPGSGGIHLGTFHPGERDRRMLDAWDIASDAPIVINPRRFRPGSVRTDVFFKAIPMVLERIPQVVFLAVGMQGHPVAERWVRKYGIEKSVRLLPAVEHREMAPLFRSADITVSPSNHDGTPNTLLEAMACGAFPVAGDIESVREWIDHGKNGLLCDPNSVDSLASTTVEALSNTTLREKARTHNLDLVATRAEYGSGMRRAEEFYASLIRS